MLTLIRLTDPQCLTIDTETLGRLLDRSPASILRDDSAGRVPKPIRIGHGQRWLVVEIEEWIRHGCPPRNEWSAIWAPIRDGEQKSAN